jgi:hypothetical protein
MLESYIVLRPGKHLKKVFSAHIGKERCAASSYLRSFRKVRRTPRS